MRFVLATDYDALKQRCRELEVDITTLSDGLRQAVLIGAAAEKERDQLRAEVQALRKDAELFRQLRDLPDELLGAPGVPCVAVPEGPRSGRYVSGPDLDAAMGKEG
jgi:cell division protein FtsB